MNNYEVHCGGCNWWGFLRQLSPYGGCPCCGAARHLEYEDKLEKAAIALEEAMRELRLFIKPLR